MTDQATENDRTCVTCGHGKREHLYYEGACYPGFVCEKACQHYLAPWTAVTGG